MNTNYQWTTGDHSGIQVAIDEAQRAAVTLQTTRPGPTGGIECEAYFIVAFGNTRGRNGNNGNERYDINHCMAFKRVWEFDRRAGTTTNDLVTGPYIRTECVSGAFPQDFHFPSNQALQIFWIRPTRGVHAPFPRRNEHIGSSNLRVGIPTYNSNPNAPFLDAAGTGPLTGNNLTAANAAMNDYRKYISPEHGIRLYLPNDQLQEIEGHTSEARTEGPFNLDNLPGEFYRSTTEYEVPVDVELSGLPDPAQAITIHLTDSTGDRMPGGNPVAWNNGISVRGVTTHNDRPHVITIVFDVAANASFQNPLISEAFFEVDYNTTNEGWLSLSNQDVDETAIFKVQFTNGENLSTRNGTSSEVRLSGNFYNYFCK